MDHKGFLKTLSPAQKAALTERRNAPGLLWLTGHALLILLLAFWVASAGPLWPLVLIPLGILIVFLFTLEHEATHKTPFASERLNEWVGRLCGFLLVLPFEWFRYFHLAHHRHTNIPGKDPELETGSRKYEAWLPFLWHVSGVPYWAGMIRTVVALACGKGQADYLPERAMPRIRREARILLALYLLAATSLCFSQILFWIWMLPAFLGQPFLRLYLMAEHGRCPKVADMFDNTRTTYTSAVVRFLAWNMPYHTEHHVLPAVPFHRLPVFHKMTRHHLLHEQDGYGRFTAETLRRL